MRGTSPVVESPTPSVLTVTTRSSLLQQPYRTGDALGKEEKEKRLLLSEGDRGPDAQRIPCSRKPGLLQAKSVILANPVLPTRTAPCQKSQILQKMKRRKDGRR